MSRNPLARIAVATAVAGTLATGVFATISSDADRTPHRSTPAVMDSAQTYLAADHSVVTELRTSKPSATPTPAPATVAPKPKTAPKKHVVKHAPARFVAGPTKWSALNAAIAHIPTYRPGVAKWVVKDTGYWGTADWYANVIYISPSVPDSKVYDVAVHEWSHLLSIVPYGDVHLAAVAMRAYFGGTDGPEIAADCMAKLQGAKYLHYTQCTNAVWIAGAKLLVAGQRL
jgi:hypothetical protein